MYKHLREKIEEGLAGDNEGLAISLGEMNGVSRLGKAFTFGGGKYVTLGGPGGVGKTSFTLYRFIFIPIWAFLKGLSKFNPYMIYHLTERQVRYAEAKILAMIIYHAEHLIYDVPTILQMSHKAKILNDSDLAIFDKYGGVLDKVLAHITFHQGAASLESMAEIQKTHLKLTTGKNLIVGHYTDHVNNITGLSEKETLSAHSDTMKLYRDNHNWFCFDISQFNREVENDYRVLKRGVQVKKSDWFGSSKFQMNCDLMLGILDPKDYDVNQYPCKEGLKDKFDMFQTTNDKGYNRFRALWIAKNNDGTASTYIPMAFAGECGVSSEIQPAGALRTYDYEKIQTGMFLD